MKKEDQLQKSRKKFDPFAYDNDVQYQQAMRVDRLTTIDQVKVEMDQIQKAREERRKQYAEESSKKAEEDAKAQIRSEILAELERSGKEATESD